MTGRHPQSVGLYPGVLFADSLKGHCVYDGDDHTFKYILTVIFWNFVENKVRDDETLARPPSGGGDNCRKSFLQWVQDCNGR